MPRRKPVDSQTKSNDAKPEIPPTTPEDTSALQTTFGDVTIIQTTSRNTTNAPPKSDVTGAVTKSASELGTPVSSTKNNQLEYGECCIPTRLD